MRTETVTSVQNPKIKKLLALQEKSRLRRETGLFVVEGRREIEHCVAAGFVIDTLFVCPEIIGSAAVLEAAIRSVAQAPEADPIRANAASRTLPTLTDREAQAPEADPIRANAASRTLPTLPDRAAQAPEADPIRANAASRTLPTLTDRAAQAPEADPIRANAASRTAAAPTIEKRQAPTIIEVPAELYAKVAYREGTEGMIAEVRERSLELTDLQLPDNPLIIVLEGVEKPGNLGAVLRSADAAGADAVLICDSPTDLYNPNLIRSSIGAVFTVPVVCCTSSDAIRWLKKKGVRIYTAQLQDSSLYYDTDMKCASAIAIGTEATGLTDAWREAADAHIRIPMLGRLDSLNASVSAAILLFEAVRQRNS